jgi:hypothetical protein
MDFNTLDISVLRRYKRIHKLKVQEPATKEQLVAAVSRHYAAVKPVENEVIATFIYAVRNKGEIPVCFFRVRFRNTFRFCQSVTNSFPVLIYPVSFL